MIYISQYDIQTDRKRYVGRGTPLGNPFTHVAWFARNKPWMTVVATRDEAVDRYEPYLRDLIAKKDPSVCGMLNMLYQTAKSGDLTLICHCHPLRCHAEVIKKILEEKL